MDATHTAWKTPTAADRINQLRRRVAASEAFISNKMNPIEHRIAERRALKSWMKSLADLGAV